MSRFAIITDSSCDLGKEFRDKYDIEYVSMYYIYNGNANPVDLDWNKLTPKQFYDLMRNGERITSAQVSHESYEQAFEKHLSSGEDVLYIGCSAALSSSVNASYVVRDELMKKYPDRTIICVDSKSASGGLSILCIRASELRAEGKSIEEVANWVEENKKFINQEGTVDKLIWLKQAGRISATKAFFGSLLNVKPLVISDVLGYNVAIEKVKGRKASIIRVAERVAENYTTDDYPGIFINHADCLEDALELKKEIMARTPVKEEDVHIGFIGTAIGGSVGPGMMGVYFYGKEVTYMQKV